MTFLLSLGHDAVRSGYLSFVSSKIPLKYEVVVKGQSGQYLGELVVGIGVDVAMCLDI